MLFLKALGRSASRDHTRLRLAGSRSLRSREPAARLVPAVLTGSGDGRDGLALSESARVVAGTPSDVTGWIGVLNGPPRSPLPPSASLAIDHSGRAAGKLAIGVAVVMARFVGAYYAYAALGDQ